MRIFRESTFLSLIGFTLLLSGCGPTELTAPCDPLAVTATLDDCGPERPLNAAARSGWLA